MKPKMLFAMACVALLAGCGSYPAGMTKEEWDRASPQHKAWLRSQEALRIREIEKGYIPESAAQRALIRDDENARNTGPSLMK